MSIAQEHVKRNAAVKVLQLHHVGGMTRTGSTVPGCLSPGTAVDLTWLLVCERCEAAVCYRVAPHGFDCCPRQRKLLLVVLFKEKSEQQLSA